MMRFLAILTLAVFLLRRSLAIVTVHGQSMVPTLHGGDRVLLLRYRWRWLLRWGQLVVCRYPQRHTYIKRLIGLGGDHVVLPAQAAPYHPIGDDAMVHEADDVVVWQVPPGCCFVKGDAAYSYDSTFWGPISLEHLVGIVLLKLPRRVP